MTWARVMPPPPVMAKLAARFPGYGWERNCGYPTIDHRAALHALGITPFHRRDFGTVRLLLEREAQLGLDLGDAAPAATSPA